MDKPHHVELVIVGGGIAGLSAALEAQAAGIDWVLLERSRLGGRAQSTEADGSHFDLGPHALYKHGALHGLLTQHGILVSGRDPQAGPRRATRLRIGTQQPLLPGSLGSLLRTRALTLSEKGTLAKLMMRLPRLDPQVSHGQRFGTWISKRTNSRRLINLLLLLVRTATYAGDPAELPAPLALRQLQLVLKGILYVDGGWQSLVEGMRRRLDPNRIEEGSSVRTLEKMGDLWMVSTSAKTWNAQSVVLAVPPSEANRLLPTLDLPVDGGFRMTWLSLLLKGRCAKAPSFLPSLEEPLYLSVPSRAAKVAPAGTTLVNVGWYHRHDEGEDAEAIDQKLHEHVSAWLPGWQALEMTRRSGRRMQVTHAPIQAGQDLRPVGQVQPNLALAGDYVAGPGWLSDGSASSAKEAVKQLGRYLSRLEPLAHAS